MTAPIRPVNPFDTVASVPRGTPATPNTPRNPFDLPSNLGGLRSAAAEAEEKNPDEYAEAFALARKTGLPVETVARNLTEARRIAGETTFDPDRFAAENPGGASWLAKPENAAVSRDDWSNIGQLGRIVGQWTHDWPSLSAAKDRFLSQLGPTAKEVPGIVRQVQRGTVAATWENTWRAQERGRIYFATTPAQRASDAALQSRLADLADDTVPEPLGLVERAFRSAANIGPSLLRNLGERVKKGQQVGAAAAGFAALAGQVPPLTLAPDEAVTVPLAAGAGFAIGAAIGSQQASMELEAGMAIEEFSKMRDENGVLIDPAVADLAGRTYGLLSSAIETVAIGSLLKPLGEQMARRVMGRAVQKALVTPTTAKVVLGAMGAWGRQVGIETAQETAQQGLQLLTEQAARTYENATTGTDFTAIPGQRVADELLTTAVETALGMALIGLPGGGGSIVSDMADVSTAKRNQQLLEALGDGAKASTLRQRAPEQFKEYLEQSIAEDGPVRHVMIPVERWDAGWQAKGIDPEQVAREGLSDPAAYTQAREQGGDVVIPLAEYVTNFAGTEHHAWLMPDLRLRVGEPTMREASESAQRAETATADLAQELADAVKGAEDTGGSAVIEDVARRLTNTGVYTPSQVEEMATTIGSWYIVAAKRAKRDPLELWRSRNIEVFGPEEATPLFEAVDALRRAREAGAGEAEIAALRSHVARLGADPDALAERRTIMAEEAERAGKPQGDARDRNGRIKVKLTKASDESLVATYLAERTAQHEDEATVEGLTTTPDGIEALELSTTGDREDAEGLMSPEDFATLNAAWKAIGKRKNGLARLASELERRGIDPDLANAEVDFDPTMFQQAQDRTTPLSDAEVGVQAALARQRALIDRARAFLIRQGRMTPDEVVGEVLEQAAFHGSPHTFDRFDLSKMGTGEGAQAYGWGAYLAENEGVAAGYHSALASRPDIQRFKVGTVTVGTFNSFDYSRRASENDVENIRASLIEDVLIREAELIGRSGDVQSFVLEILDEKIADYKNEDNTPEWIAAAEKLRKELSRKGAVSLKLSDVQGGVYRVDIPDAAVAKFLDWDKSLSEQAAGVQGVLRRVTKTVWKEAVTQDDTVARSGGAIYSALAGALGQEATSKALLAAGIPGIKYLDAGSRGAGGSLPDAHGVSRMQGGKWKAVLATGEVAGPFETEGAARSWFDENERATRNLVVFDENLITITHRNGEPITAQERTDFLEQSKDTGKPNAFILPGVRQTTIGLLATANLSSALHEFGHDYLNLLRDLATAPDAEPSLVADWAIVTRELGITDTATISKRAQEQWARMLEHYYLDGTAPTQGLARAFARFRVWFLAIYQHAKQLLLPVSPEMRGVFDRMLATEEEIAAETAEPETGPLFTDAESAGMTDAQFAAYAIAHADQKERSKARLLAALLAEQNKGRTEAWQERQAEVQAVVTRQVDADPAQNVVHFLRTGESLADPETPTVTEPPKLSQAVLTERYPADIAKRLPLGVTASVGADPDFIALQFGFAHGDELVAALQTFEERKVRIARLTAEQMQREFPDLLRDSPSLADAARRAMHEGPSEGMLVEELKRLAATDAAIPPPHLPSIKAQVAAVIRRTEVRNINARAFELAEQKAARLAFKAARAGDMAQAAFHQRQRLLNHLLSRAARDAREYAEKVRVFAGRMGTPKMMARFGLAGEVYANAMSDLLAQYEFRKVSLTKLDRRDALAAWVKEQETPADGSPGVPVEVPPSVLEDARQVNYRQLTVEQLEGVYETMQQIHHTAMFKERLLAAHKKRTMQALEDEVVGGIGSHHDIAVRDPDYHPSAFTKAGEGLKKWDAWHLKPELLLRWLDGDVAMGPAHQAIFQPIVEAENAELRMLEAVVPRLQALQEMVPAAVRRDYTKRLDVVPQGARVRRMSRGTIIAILRNWGSEGNREALLAGRVDGDTGTVWTRAAVESLFAHLTRAEVEMVQAEWDYINEFWPDIVKIQKEMTGVAPEKVEASPITVTIQGGETVELRGGYFPLVYDPRYSTKQEQADAKAAVQELGASSYTRAATRHGFTEARVGSGGRPVRLDLSVLPAHILSVVHDLTHRRAIYDVGRFIERPNVRNAIIGSAGKHLYNTLKPWLQRIASDQHPPSSPVEGLLGRLRTGATVVNMGLKVTTAIVQPLGFSQTLDVVGTKYGKRGLTLFFQNPAEAFRLANEHSVMMRGRATSFDRDVRDMASKLASKGKFDKASQFFFVLTSMTDKAVSVASWHAGYLQSIEVLHPGDHAKAVQYADLVVRQSQGTGSAKDLAQIQGGADNRRIFTMFYSYFNLLYGLGRRSGAKTVKAFQTDGLVGVVQDSPRLVASMFALWFLPAILSEYVAGRGPDDDEDKLTWAAWELARYPLSAVVGLRDIAAAIGPDAYRYSMSPVEDAIRTSVQAGEAVAGHAIALDIDFTAAEVKQVLNTTGYWLGLPTRQANITLGYLYDLMMGYERPESAPEVVRNLAFPRRR